MKALTVRGPFRGTSGYEHHVREYLRGFHQQGIGVELVELEGWGLEPMPEALSDPWFESLRTPIPTDLVLHFCVPTSVARSLGRINVNHTMFEATRVCTPWIEHNRHHDLVIVPTDSSRQAWINSGFPAKKIRVCPYGVDIDLFSANPAPLPLSLPDGRQVTTFSTRFLNISEFGPRKNLIGLLRVWMEATHRDDDAVLILKTSYTSPARRPVFQRQIQQLEASLGRKLAQAAPIYFLDEIFADNEMPRVYATATHYISLSFGEGWDQPMMEAAASDLRLIAPDHSAYTSYLSASTADLIPSTTVPVIFQDELVMMSMFAGAQWWRPDEEIAAGYVRAAIAGASAPKPSSRESIARGRTWEKSTRQLLEILDDVAGSRPRRRLWSRSGRK